jgi:hypothetical protein
VAETFEIVGQRLTADIVGGHDLIDVWEVSAKSRPTGVYFTFRVGLDEHRPEIVDARAAQIARELERVAAHQHVSEVAYVQEIGRTGQLVDHVDVHYSTLDGRHHGATRYPLDGITADTVVEHVEQAVAHLDAIAGL